MSLAPKITTADARIAWNTPAYAVDRQIRAHTPAPGAWSTLRDQRVKLGPVRPAEAWRGLGPGELRVEHNRVLRYMATAPVELSAVQPAGKRSMPALDWLRGLHLRAGADGHTERLV